MIQRVTQSSISCNTDPLFLALFNSIRNMEYWHWTVTRVHSLFRSCAKLQGQKAFYFQSALFFFPRFRKKFDRCHFNLSFRLQTVNFTKSFSSGFIRLKNEADFENKKNKKKQIVTFCEDQFFSTSNFLFVGKLKFISWKHYSMGCSDVVIYNFFF